MTDLLSLKPKNQMEKVAHLVELEKASKSIKAQIDAYKAELLAVTQELGVITLKTGNYTVTRATRITPHVVNFKQLKKSLDKADIPYETQEVFADHMKETFRQAIKEEKDLDGLEAMKTEFIMIRLPKTESGVNKE